MGIVALLCALSYAQTDSSTLQCGSSVSGSTVGRSSQVGYRSGEVTYEFTAESSTSVTFDLCDSEYDTFLRIFDDSGDEIARNDDHRGRCGSSRNRLASHVETTVHGGSGRIQERGGKFPIGRHMRE